MPHLRSGDAPAKTGVEATQHFTQPPPRYSEASLVKRMEELGIGRPSTYAATLQTLKDRDYVAASFASRTMRWSGIIVALFVALHLLDLTWGSANPDFRAGDPYHNVVESFQRWPVAIAWERKMALIPPALAPAWFLVNWGFVAVGEVKKLRAFNSRFRRKS